MPASFRSTFERIRSWFGWKSAAPEKPDQPPEPGEPPLPAPVSPKVCLLIFDPALPSQRGRRLRQVMGWNDPEALAEQYIQDVAEISYGYANYQITERIVADGFPAKQDGFAYSGEEYLKAMGGAGNFHQPDQVSYEAILANHHLVEKINQGSVDEVWMMGFPYAGFYESRMAGPGAFWCNAPPLENTGANRRFVIMGFNYQRGVGEMLENLGHRTKSIMTHVFRKFPRNQNLWERYIRHEDQSPGKSEVGTVHFAPNSKKDYDWGNRTAVLSRADTWLNFPDLRGEPRTMTSSDWGGGDIRGHHKWWFRRLPHIKGEMNGIANNWWQYVIDPNRVR